MEDVAENNGNSFCNVDCDSGVFIDANGKERTNRCFEDSKRQRLTELRSCCSLEPKRKDCLTPGLGEKFAPLPERAPAIEFVRQYASDELKWLGVFTRAWKKATENGFGADLKPLMGACPAETPLPTAAPTTVTPTATPTTFAPTATSEKCKSWCGVHTTPWSVKCAWSHACSQCSDCEALPTEAPKICLSWCSTDARPWPVKCAWPHSCNQCSDCEALPTEDPTATSENCKSWCGKNTNPWSVKCAWPHSCNHCSDCEALPTEAPTATSENCKSWCGKNTNPWSVKCAWPHSCNHCSQCGS